MKFHNEESGLLMKNEYFSEEIRGVVRITIFSVTFHLLI